MAVSKCTAATALILILFFFCGTVYGVYVHVCVCGGGSARVFVSMPSVFPQWFSSLVFEMESLPTPGA